jgi:hypothetical protein
MKNINRELLSELEIKLFNELFIKVLNEIHYEYLEFDLELHTLMGWNWNFSPSPK